MVFLWTRSTSSYVFYYMATIYMRHSLIPVGACEVDLGKKLNVRRDESRIESALKDLAQARSLSMTSTLRDSHDLMRRDERASILALNGGSPGDVSITSRLMSQENLCYFGSD